MASPTSLETAVIQLKHPDGTENSMLLAHAIPEERRNFNRLVIDCSYKRFREQLSKRCNVSPEMSLVVTATGAELNDEDAFHMYLNEVVISLPQVAGHKGPLCLYLDVTRKRRHSSDPPDSPSQGTEGSVSKKKRVNTPLPSKSPVEEEEIESGEDESEYEDGGEPTEDLRPLPYFEEDDIMTDDGRQTDDGDRESDDDDFVQQARQNIDDDVWKRVCTFFQCHSKVSSLQLPGLRLPLQPYQLHGVWFALSRCLDNIFSAIIADDVGLGKTAMALAVMLLHHQIQMAWAEVEADRDSHLPQGAQAADSVCPGQKSFRFGFQCPCVERSDTFRISQRLAALPIIVVAPPNLLNQWVREVGKWMDFSTQTRPINNMEFKILHSQVSAGLGGYTNVSAFTSDMYDLIKPTQLLCTENCRTEGGWGPPVGTPSEDLLSKYVTLIAPKGFQPLYKGYAAYDTNLVASIVFMDEVHSYKGSKENPHGAFKALRSMAKDSLCPTLAVGLSASMLGSGPKNWRPFASHLLQVADSRGLKPNVPHLSSVKDVDSWIRDYDYIIKNSNSSKARSREYAIERLDALRPILEAFIPRVVLCRLRGDKFRGKSISDSGRTPVTKVYLDTLESSNAHKGLRELSTRIRTWIDEIYDLEMENWEKTNKLGNAPDRDETQRNLLNKAFPQGDRSTEEYNIMKWSSTFPYISVLYLTGNISQSDCTAKECLHVSRQITSYLHGQRRNQLSDAQVSERILQELQQSPFWRYRRLLKDYSPKFQRITNYVRQLLAVREHGAYSAEIAHDFKALGQGPPDDSGVRHMLLFSEYPISSFLTFMLLFDEFGMDGIEWLYMHGGTNMNHKTIMIRDIQENVEKGGKMKILTTTCGLMGTGLEMQRANYAVLTEAPSKPEYRQQVIGRVDRQGQTQELNLIQLLDKRNLAEMAAYKRGLDQAELAKEGFITNDINFDDFIGNGETTIDEEEVERLQQ
ncbi:uncharacterized protein F4822DRAFT_440079 [Hypoxylon trugodes]|uniref:uncharacterized protein n=1 Tax=Hypoxylon trugodes TaxID=326681 RepID=UPI0021964F99|nr:uncharacterized protein F4822DRAFT_440079 [Hypoxylon trugodes]KAI1383849.1 hypothetical protein F4822DRAFT_440079 [Hypoxylon trugodes]